MSLDKILDSRKKTSQWPALWRPEKMPKILGRVVNIRKSYFDQNKNVYEIHDFTTNKIWTLPGHAILTRLFTESDVDVGDVVMVEYAGRQKSKKGRDAYSYNFSVLESEVFEKLVEDGKIPPPPENPSIAVDTTVEEARKVTTVIPNMEPPTRYEELVKYVKELSEFYDTINKSDLDNYVNKIKTFNIPIDKVIEICGLTVVGDKVKLK